MVMVTQEAPPPRKKQKDRHDLKYYLPATSLAAIINDFEVVISLCYVSSLKYTYKIFEQVHKKKIEEQKKEEEDDDDDIDLFGSDDEEEDDEAQKLREERLKQYADKKSKSE